MKTIRTIILIAIIGAIALFAFRTYQIEKHKSELKQHLIELSKIQYGLFNVDEWKIILAEIITKKIDEFNLDDTNRDELREKITSFLETTIDDLERSYYKKKSRSIVGFIQSGVATITGTFGAIKEDIPKFAEQILDFLNEKENRDAIREYLIKRLDTYADETFSDTDYSKVVHIMEKYNQNNRAATIAFLEDEIAYHDAKNKSYKLALVGFALLSLVLLFFFPNISKLEIALFLFICFVFLLIGVLLPMIEIDARISSITFNLLGEKIQFTDQVLYFKSKSILEVVRLMIFQNRIDLIFVGLLVLALSVLFPVLKLITSLLYLLNPKIGHNKFVAFMVFKSGKWSMADVMVIAVFMAYIGFDGIISEQLSQLEKIAPNLELLTTNKSDLMFGFYSFTIFVLLSLFVSQKIQSRVQDSD